MSPVRHVGFYTEGPPFEGDSVERGALGGSETAFVEITRAMARLGCEVTAFNNCARPAIHRGVEYHPFKSSLPTLAKRRFDVMVVSRFFGFFNLPIKAELKVLWNHDTLESAGGLRNIQDEIDLFFVLSRFHRDNYLTRLPQLDDRMVVTRNGLNFELLDGSAEGAARDPDKLMYASRPERGLKPLLEEIWPRLKEARPGLKLHICGYDVDRASLDPKLPPLYDYLDFLARGDPAVTVLGSLPKREYYRHLAESAMLVYPCTFPEISCIVALEAQALGTPILTSDSFALSESVASPEFRVKGRPGAPRYVRDYVDRALKLLSDPEGTSKTASECRAKVRERYSWDQVAKEWMRIFDLSLRARETRRLIVESSAVQRRDVLLV
ncbi:MAG: glycosyltransferase family 4 protein [Deltaproteobacteria bacterium]|nr:glycosyltransferase family 4 protein [Deltaproteobacteria bacterium]